MAVNLKSWPIGAAVNQHKTELMRKLQKLTPKPQTTGFSSGVQSSVPEKLEPIKTMKFPSINLTST